jgi:hypothetical protein
VVVSYKPDSAGRQQAQPPTDLIFHLSVMSTRFCLPGHNDDRLSPLYHVVDNISNIFGTELPISHVEKPDGCAASADSIDKFQLL